MIFYNQNLNQNHNKKFLEIQTKLNYSYWIASDVDHYHETSKAHINTHEYIKLLEQYQIAQDLFNDISIDKLELSKDQKKCLKAQKVFVGNCLREFNISSKSKPKDSELEEIHLMELSHIEEEFHKTYLNYLHPNEMEAYTLRAFSLFQKGCESIMLLCSEIEFNNDTKIEELSNKTINYFKSARILIENAINDPNTIEFILDELAILMPNQLLNKDEKKFIDLNFDYLKLWKEYFMAHERYCKDILNRDDQDDSESDLFEFECNNYLSLINTKAIDISKYLLKTMQTSFPDLEIYSQRIFKSPIDYIQNRRR